MTSQSHAEHQHQHGDPLVAYILVFLALLILLGATVGAYVIDFSDKTIAGIHMGFLNTVIALTIATIKTLLVMAFFMHLRHGSKLTWVIAAAGFLWLGIMVTFTFADYQARGAIPESGKQPIGAIRVNLTEKSP